MTKPTAAHLKLLLLPVLAAFLGGCGGSSNSGTTSLTPLSVSAKSSSGMTLTLSENTSVIPVGGNVLYTLTLTNSTFYPVTVDLGIGCTENVRTGTLSGVVQFFGPAGQDLNQVICQSEGVGQPVNLAPGQSLTGTLNSSDANFGGGFLTPGTYTTRGGVRFFVVHGGSVGSLTTGALPLTVH